MDSNAANARELDGVDGAKTISSNLYPNVLKSQYKTFFRNS